MKQSRITLSTPPWPNPSGDDWDHVPDFPDPPLAHSPPKLVGKPVRKVVQKPVSIQPITTKSGALNIMAARSFTGNLNASDLRYMAMAILQLQDELFEARERIKRLEADLPMKG